MPDDNQDDLFRPPVTRSEVLAVFRHWCKAMAKKSAFLDKRRDQAIRNALHMGATIEDCKRAIDGCRASRWHMGDNDRHLIYNDLELILRDAAHIERFLEIEECQREREAQARQQRIEETAERKPMPEWARERARSLRLLTSP